VEFRAYNPEKDREAVHRIWRETGWLEKDKEEAMDLFVECGRALVADIAGEPECLVITAPGTVRHLSEDLPLSCVTGVTTSRIARKQGFAGKLTAAAIAQDVADGALVSALGMFEQGYYNQHGFGTGGYEHWISFVPASLKGTVKPGVPRRITADDWEAVHACRLQRRRGHGACNLTPSATTRAEMMWAKKGFGLGYADGESGKLSHLFWCEAKEGGEHGPYTIQWMVYSTREQFLELLALLKNLGDQVFSIRLREPAGIQLQDLISQPFKHYDLTEKGKYEARASAYAYWQMRICDVAGCLEKTRLPHGGVQFNLQLTDPIEHFLDADAPWRGCAGDYVVTLGKSSSAERGKAEGLPTLKTTVNAFTRMWLGVLPAASLNHTDDLEAPPELLEALDEVLRLPAPHPDWDF
jgi:hypothetical protein